MHVIYRTFAYIGILLILLPVRAFAADLIEIYHSALKNDPIYQAAISTRAAAYEALPQSEAALLPQIGGTVAGNLIQPNMGQWGGTSDSRTTTYQLTLAQPLINIGQWINVHETDISVKANDAQLAAAGQDLIIRVATAYLNTLQAQAILKVAEKNKSASHTLLTQAQALYDVGNKPINDFYTARVAYDKAANDTLTQQLNLQVQQEGLRNLTAHVYTSLNEFKKPLPVISPSPNSVEIWIQTALKQNFNLLADRFKMLATQQDIKVQEAGHLPNLALTGALTKTIGNNTLNPAMLSNGPSVGLQLNVPLYQGGSVLSKTRQAEAMFEAASANYEGTYLTVQVTTRNLFNTVLNNIEQIKNDKTALLAAQASYGTQAEIFHVGSETINFVVLAQQTLYSVQQQLIRDENTYLINTLLLKQQTGSLRQQDLQALNQFLH